MIPKFRAWKKINTQEMLNDVRAIDFDKRMIKIGYPLSRDTTRIDTESLDNVKLMRSTGLKDKNGTEIYEGDIVAISDHPLQRTKGKYSGVPIGIEINGYYPVKYSCEDMAFFIGNWKTREVIYCSEVVGNIYENPELLEDN